MADTAQEALRDIARSVVASGLARMSEYVETPGADMDVVIKIVNSAAKDIGQVIPEKKLDPRAGLATITFNMINGSMQMQVSPPQDLDLVEEVQAELAMLDFTPTPNMLANANINQEVLLQDGNQL